MDYIFFLASLSNDAFDILLTIIEKYETYSMKDQKQTASQAKKTMKNKSKPDLIASRFKPLRGLKEEDLIEVLSLVNSNKLSIKEAGVMSAETKTLYAAKDNFLRISGISTWDEATKRFPDYTTNEALLGFSYEKGKCGEDFNHFINMILREEENSNKGEKNDSATPVFVNSDPLDFTPDSLGSDFHGVQLIALHCNKEWDNKDITVLMRKLVGLNARKGIKDFSTILFGKSKEELHEVISAVHCSHAENMYFFSETTPQEKNHLTPAVEIAVVLIFGRPKIIKNNATILEGGKSVVEAACEGMATFKSSVMEIGDKAGEMLSMSKKEQFQLFVITSKTSRITTLRTNFLQMQNVTD